MSAPFPLEPALTGLVLPGGFRLEEAVAEGASGTVVRAHQESLRRKVAVKISHAADEAAVARARREAQIVAKVDAPGIVRVFASGQLEDGRAWVAMEWIDGITLEQAVEHGPLAVPRALAIASQIARALDHANAAGVIHRDLGIGEFLRRSPPVGGQLGERGSTAASTASGTLRRWAVSAAGSPVMTLAMIACAVGPVNEGSPISIS